MPIPKPHAGEGKDEYIKRCMSDDCMVQTYQDNKQRYAICINQWKNKSEYTGAKRDVDGKDKLIKKLRPQTYHALSADLIKDLIAVYSIAQDIVINEVKNHDGDIEQLFDKIEKIFTE
jgi:hypothetical protein